MALFTQEGLVFARGELWKATSDGGIIQKDDTVQVRQVRAGLVLVVSRVQKAESGK
jgi:membrane-bound ClpP family serine protease